MGNFEFVSRARTTWKRASESDLLEESNFAERYLMTTGYQPVKLQDRKILDFAIIDGTGEVHHYIELKTFRDRSYRQIEGDKDFKPEITIPFAQHKFTHAAQIFEFVGIPTFFVHRWRTDPAGVYYFWKPFGDSPQKHGYQMSGQVRTGRMMGQRYTEASQEIMLMVPLNLCEKVMLSETSAKTSERGE